MAQRTCSIDGCESPAEGRRWCSKHYARWRRNGDPVRLLRRYSGVGGTRPRRDGYVDVWDPSHPLARADGYLMQHRKVAWDAGLLTDPAMQVHHVNHDRTDNRIENLEVKSAEDHASEHATEAGFITNQFGTFPVRPIEERTAPRPVYLCAQCGQPIPVTRRSDARFCASPCRQRAKRARRAA